MLFAASTCRFVTRSVMLLSLAVALVGRLAIALDKAYPSTTARSMVPTQLLRAYRSGGGNGDASGLVFLFFVVAFYILIVYGCCFSFMSSFSAAFLSILFADFVMHDKPMRVCFAALSAALYCGLLHVEERVDAAIS